MRCGINTRKIQKLYCTVFVIRQGGAKKIPGGGRDWIQHWVECARSHRWPRFQSSVVDDGRFRCGRWGGDGAGGRVVAGLCVVAGGRWAAAVVCGPCAPVMAAIGLWWTAAAAAGVSGLCNTDNGTCFDQRLPERARVSRFPYDFREFRSPEKKVFWPAAAVREFSARFFFFAVRRTRRADNRHEWLGTQN